jgi:hypothetical protein
MATIAVTGLAPATSAQRPITINDRISVTPPMNSGCHRPMATTMIRSKRLDLGIVAAVLVIASYRLL